MGEATVRELRNQGGVVIERVLAGERITITRDGEPVAELRPLPKRPLSREALLEIYRGLPPIDPDRFRADIDAVIDQSI
ncbi:MAG: type II toxin-antitoxin system Phd/YefM family antitoxin [Sporichthyaceae bacterium]